MEMPFFVLDHITLLGMPLIGSFGAFAFPNVLGAAPRFSTNFFEGMTQAEIAKVMGVPSYTVNNRLHKARGTRVRPNG